MLNRMQDVRKACAPHKYRFGDDERQPNGLVPKPKKANDADADGGKSQFHLKATIHRPSDPFSDLVSINDVAKKPAHDGEPSGQPDCVDGYDLNG